MPTQQQAPHRILDTPDDLAETRLEAVGYVFHGQIGLPNGNGKKPAVKAGANLLHFARCMKLDKVADGESIVWFRTISIAKAHLDETFGADRWKWCKVCEREITQKILNER